MKIGLGVIGLFALLVVFILGAGCVLNPGVIKELAEEPEGERAQKVMMLTLPSGKQIPVNYLHEGGKVYAASDHFWHRELVGGADVTVVVMGVEHRGRARVVDDDPEYRADIFSRLRPTAPLFMGVMVEIRPEEPVAR